jgi:hypothetical protein
LTFGKRQYIYTSFFLGTEFQLKEEMKKRKIYMVKKGGQNKASYAEAAVYHNIYRTFPPFLKKKLA